GLPVLTGCDFPGGLADQGGEGGNSETPQDVVSGVQQGRTSPDPCADPGMSGPLEPRGRVALPEEPHQITTLPCAVQVGPCSGEEQLHPALLALCLGFGHGAGGVFLLLGMVPFVQREEEFALGTEVVVESADAEARSFHHVGHGGLGEALLVEDLAGRIEKYLARLDSTTPLPGA